MTGHITGTNFIDHLKKQQMLVTARSKQKLKSSEAARTSSALSSSSYSRSTPLNQYKDNNSSKPTNASSVAAQDSNLRPKQQSFTEEQKEKKKETFSGWFNKKNKAGSGLKYKFTNFDNRLIRWLLENQGFKESTQDYGMPAADFYNIANATNCNFLNSNSVVLIWSASVVKSNIYSNLGRFQKVNHFPRSYEITRKDCLYERYSRMQALYGNKNFNFMPASYNCP